MPTAQGIRAGRAFVEIFADDRKLVQGLRSAQRRLTAFGASVRSAGMKLMAVGGTLAAPLSASVKIFAGFSDRMAEVRAVTGASQEQFEQLEATAKKLGASTSFTASQVAEGMKFLGMAGFKTEQILAGIPAVLNLARAGAIDLGLAADIASDVGSAFGMTAEEIAHIADVMAVTASSANTNIEMMGETLKYAAPLAKAAGQSLEDTATAVGILGNSGIKASMAGTDLALIMKKIGGESRQALASVGVHSVDAQGRIRSVLEVMKELGAATRGMSEAQRLKFFADAFDRSAKSAIILADAGSSMDELRAKIGAADGAAARMAATMDDNVGGAFRQLMSAVEGIAIAVGDALAPVIREWASKLTLLAQKITEIVSKNREFVTAVAKGVAIAVAVGAALVGAGVAISAVGTVFGAVASVVAGLGAALGMIGAALGALISPLGLVIAGAAALAGVLLYATGVGSQALAWLGERFQALKTTALAAWRGISDALAAGDLRLAARILWLSLKMEWQRGIHFLNGLWIKFKEFFLSTASSAVFGTAKILNNGWAAIEVGWTETVGFLADAWSVFTNLLTKTWHSAIGFIKKAWVRLKAVFDKDVDVQAEVTRINRETSEAVESADQKMLDAVGQRDRQRRAQREQIERDRAGVEESLTQMQAEETARRQQKFAADLAKTESDLAKARREWEEAIAEAARKRAAEETAETGDAQRLAKAQESLSASSHFLADQQKQIEVKGTFNPLALRGLGADSLAERTARASEQVVVNTKQLVDQAKQGRLVFGP